MYAEPAETGGMCAVSAALRASVHTALFRVQPVLQECRGEKRLRWIHLQMRGVHSADGSVVLSA